MFEQHRRVPLTFATHKALLLLGGRNPSRTAYPLDLTRSLYLSRYPLMKPFTLRLPIETWEMVINSLHDPGDTWLPADRDPTLLACSLVCSGWLRESRRVLYHKVGFTHQHNIALFIRTITGNPPLADLVRRLVVDPKCTRYVFDRPQERRYALGWEIYQWRTAHQPWQWLDSPIRYGTYINFTHGTLIDRLRHLEDLELRFLDLHKDYPPNLTALVGRFPIRELTLWNCSLPLVKTFELIWSLRNLRRLSLHCTIDGSVPENIHSQCLKLHEIQFLRPRTCAQLQELELGGLYTSLEHFPPHGAFGNAVRSLSLIAQICPVQYKSSTPSAEAFVAHLVCPSDFIHTLTQLRLLKVTVNVQSYGERHIKHWNGALRASESPNDPSWGCFHIPINDIQEYHLFLQTLLTSLPTSTSLNTLAFSWRFNVRHKYQLRRDMLRTLFPPDIFRTPAKLLRNIELMELNFEEPYDGLPPSYWKAVLEYAFPDLGGRIEVRTRVLPVSSDDLRWWDDVMFGTPDCQWPRSPQELVEDVLWPSATVNMNADFRRYLRYDKRGDLPSGWDSIYFRVPSRHLTG
ncbi:hypothetical protein C8Q76DRAFT_792923 [Earliella scabrosa]|nr:hypothetical protein C8Q76DRAFT_792923 [Earliella scabrosa]